jgi:hypothetical protein
MEAMIVADLVLPLPPSPQAPMNVVRVERLYDSVIVTASVSVSANDLKVYGGRGKGTQR